MFVKAWFWFFELMNMWEVIDNFIFLKVKWVTQQTKLIH